MKLLNVSQLADSLNVRPKTIYDWVHKERIPHLKLGKLVRFDQAEIDRWIKTKRRGKTAASG